MFGFSNIKTNVNGTPYLRTQSINVTADNVDFSLGWSNIPPVGYFTVNIMDAVPTGTTGTLPVRLVLNGNARNVTVFGGGNLTAADIVGTGVITVFYNGYTGLLQLVSPLSV